jgi:hypothetical protein
MATVEEFLKGLNEHSKVFELNVEYEYTERQLILFAEQYAKDQLKEREEEFKKVVIEAMKEYGTFLIMCEREGKPLLLAEDYYREYFNTKHKDK